MEMAEYRAMLIKDDLGWVLYKSEKSFRPVHRVLNDPENGPVIIVGSEVLEVDPDVDAVFVDDIQALDAYYKEQK